MLKIDINQTTRTALLEPEGHLTQQDFESLTALVDPLIHESGSLNGVLIHARNFPGWDNFAAFLAHLQFVNAHHKQVKKVAICTDSFFGSLVEKLAEHFIAAEIKHFSYADLNQAQQWINQ